MFSKRIRTIYFKKEKNQEPFRGDLLNIEKLGEYARLLAVEQHTGTGTKNNYLRERLTDNEDRLHTYNTEVLSEKNPGYISPATEWLVDNYYLVEEHIQLARHHFPKSYSKELPALLNGPYQGLPRIYGIVAEYISHVDSQIDDESLCAFFRAYQEITPLKLGELWAIPIMLRLILIENLRRIVVLLEQNKKERDLADQWMDKIEKTSKEKPSALVEIISEMAKANLPFNSAFVAGFYKRISNQNPSLQIVRNWFEQHLHDEGLTTEELIRTENQQQAADQLSVSHCITSFRFLNNTDWRTFIEKVSIVEDILKRDPVNIYAAMDFISRDHYRHEIEKLAKQSQYPEEEVATQVIELAKQAATEGKEERETHVGYYLIEDGIQQLKKQLKIKETIGGNLKHFLKTYPLTIYTGTILLISLSGTLLFAHIVRASGSTAAPGELILSSIFFFIFLSQFAVFLVNYLSTLIIPPDFLPRLDFAGGIPSSFRSVFVVPAMISNRKGIKKLLSDIEIHYLSNPDSNLSFALLTDFTDADQEHMPQDEELREYIQQGIKDLNNKYGSDTNSLFYLFHRPRTFESTENKWMGYERKRGKLMAFNNFLTKRKTDDFSLIEGNQDALNEIKYVITLDADTQLPPYSAYKLVGTMAHILNQPVIDPQRNIVVKGYGILQPRVGINLLSSLNTYYSRMFTGDVGIDPYTRTVSDVYQDIFHAGSFVGKGIYAVDTFEKVLGERFPENKILSHDLLESTYTRSGLATDIEMYESYPATYIADAKRRHRWMRGDWQTIQWLFPEVPTLHGKEPNPLSGLSKWKIADNLRRSLVSPLTLLFLTAAFIWFPNHAWIALLVLITVIVLPFIVTMPVNLLRKSKEESWFLHVREIGKESIHQLKQIFYNITVFPYEAWLCTDAMIRSIWRMTLSHRHLLQWQTAEEADKKTVNTISGMYREMWFSPLFAIVCTILLWKYPETLFYTFPFMLLWIIAPYMVWFVNQPIPVKKTKLTHDQKQFLHAITRKIWYFFETFVNANENHLPPDNYQEVPNPVIATRTSPTNIGLSLLANVVANDFGYLSVNGMIERIHNTFMTLTRLKKYRGHFYNWYDTRTLEPLYPLYISTVDSGNLAGNLITLSQSLREQLKKPVYSPVIFNGLLDTVLIMRELDQNNSVLMELEEELSTISLPEKLSLGYELLKSVKEKIETLNLSIYPEQQELYEWGKTLAINCEDHLNDILYLFPWLEKEESTIYLEYLRDTIPTLDELSKLPLENIQEELTDIQTTIQRAAERKKILLTLALHGDSMCRMDFEFLYNNKKKLFTIGYNVLEQRYDQSSYDMLASEARLVSYLTIAQGQVPIDHWFALGRLVTLLKGKPILLSWSGSMFEYLMPLLLMPDYPQTLLNETYKGVLKEQITYGNKFNVPWGISESGYNRPDTQFNYQYHAFGIPSLGLQRGLSKDLVIAPYATLLGLMVDAQDSIENLERLKKEGQEGKYGYYEAIDYTPAHLPINEKKVTIFSFMAHHQGMGLLSLANLLKDNCMQKRFIGTPQMKAFELLLQERIPHNISTNVISDTSQLEIQNLHALHANNPHVERTYNTSHTNPEVNLLSNGSYQLMINTAGSGYSRWNDVAVTRWRKDHTSDTNGFFIYLRDVNNGHFWSAGHQPICLPVKNYEANFTQAYAEFKQHHTGLDTVMTVCISPEDDVELRCIKLTNHTHKNRTIEVTSYAEVVINTQGADEAHPVFSKLFVQTNFNPDIPALFCSRRPGSDKEHPPHLFHLMQLEHPEENEITYETDRARFIGRGNTLANPKALQDKTPLSGTLGSVLDPIVSLRRVVTIPPGKSVRICVALGIAPTSQAAFELAEKYQNVRMTDRAFELAWTHSQVVLYHLNIREAEAQLYQKLAGSLIYLNPAFRAEPTILKNNRKGQNGLWGYSISGDVPLVLVRISKNKGIELVRQLILAHAYWRLKGLTVEMLILNEDKSVYRQPLHDEIINQITTSVEAPWLNKAGGIVVRPIEQIPSEDLILLQSAASLIFNDQFGTLAEQTDKDNLPGPYPPKLNTSTLFNFTQENIPLPVPQTILNNGYGGFSPDGKEYIITLVAGQNTPAPWSNVIANPMFGTVISESGGSYTWYENAHEFRLTPWYNDPIKDTSGEAIYIRDEENGHYWSPTPLPTRGNTPYIIRHGFGYTTFEHIEEGIASQLQIYVAMDTPVKISTLRLKNHSGHTRQITITGYCEWVMGDTRTRNQQYITTHTDPDTGALYARNYYNTDFADKIAFMDMGRTRWVTGDRTEFLGAGGSTQKPAAMERKRLSGKTGAGFDPCGAMQTTIELKAGEEKEIRILIGCANNEHEMSTLVTRFRQPGSAAGALENVHQYWKRTLGSIQVNTPDPTVNMMANGWLLYQTLSCRIWARSGYYQSGGAYGFRDQLQDVMALSTAEPAIMREQILRAARHQFKKGDVQHWWHPPFDRGVRTHFSDDYLWLPYVTYHYITTVKDTGILNEIIPFIEGRELNPGEESYYDTPMLSDESANLYEHCVRSIRYGLKFGIHGLPLMGCGDWNDGMNLVGIEGKGESVWLAFFLYDVLKKFNEIALLYGDRDFANVCLEQARQLEENIRANAWDGNWYRRAYFDDGTPLGSKENPECKIDNLPQSWSVISGAGDPDRSRSGMEEINRQLVDRELRIIRLFTPSFNKFEPSPGYIKGYIPGVRENGGQYTHGVIWTAIAFAQMGETEKAWELFDLLNPIHHGSTEKEIETYKTEPYVIAADVYSATQHPGRGGWTWYTGSSAWFYRLAIETLLGINRRGDKLHLTPHMRKEWKSYTISYTYYDTVYEITFQKLKDHIPPYLTIDGEEQQSIDTIPLINDQQTHTVEVGVENK